MPRISRSLLSWVFTELPVCWFGGGAGSGAALSRRLSRKSTEPQSQAGAPEPTLAAAAAHRWRRRGSALGCSRRDTGCDTPTTDRESSNNGTTPATWRRAAHVHKIFSNAEQETRWHAGNSGFCLGSDVNGCCCWCCCWWAVGAKNRLLSDATGARNLMEDT